MSGVAIEPHDQLGSVALVHDYLNQRGGAERVVLEMAAMWPGAPIHTSLYRPESTFPEFQAHEVRTSFLDRLPVDRRFRALLPLYPAAFRSLGEIDADVILSSSSGWAHGVRRTPDSLHAVYCHTPARWLYGAEYMRGPSWKTAALGPLLGALRRHDCRAAERADVYIANSDQTRRRIREVYCREATVVSPPIDTDRFTPRPRGDRLLVVSRLLPYKRVDLIVDAATQTGMGLDVVGVGPELDGLSARAGPSVAFHGRLPDAEVTKLMEGCRTLCLPGVEDFGITPVEANAAGKPVVAFGEGGALETLEDGRSGIFFREHAVESVIDAVRRCDDLATSPEHLAEHAELFSRAAFRQRLGSVLRKCLAGERSPGELRALGAQL